MVLFVVGAITWSRVAKAAPKPKAAADVPEDDLKRSLRLDTYRIVADSGAARGEVIDAYKCWMCHNQYAKGGPSFKDLYQRPQLMAGAPVNDETVTAKVKEGGPLMPASRTTMSDSDIADPVAYLRSGKCCVEGENPPLDYVLA